MINSLLSRNNPNFSQKGFTLIELILGIAVFAIVAGGFYGVYGAAINAVRLSRVKITSTALANEQFEIIRNLSYDDVGIMGGIPLGKIPRFQNFTRNGIQFAVETTIRNIDDPFDGTIGGNPNDLSPADYKMAELEISCGNCGNFPPLAFNTYIGPRALETASTNGALFIQAFDSSGQPVANANVHIVNNQTIPAIIIDETTNNDGILQIIDAPPSAQSYEITVSKSGYSTDKTYSINDLQNPNPVKPHSTVAVQQVTQISFAIDRVSELNIASLTKTCGAVSSINFSMDGAKLIGSNPDVLKYSASHFTDANGIKTFSDLEWDSYSINLSDESYDLAGAMPLLPIAINPNSSQNLKLIVTPKNPRNVLVGVKDASSLLPLTDATVRLEGINYDTTIITGRGSIRQTDWSGGAGQSDFIDVSKYFDSDGNINIDNPSGEIHLKETFGQYTPSGYLISSTFDTGSASNFYELSWLPQDQPPQTGVDSVKLQIAANNNKTTWNFIGPDGTENTYYTLSNQNINSLHNGNRYLRYKVFLQTEDPDWTPIVSDISFTFTSDCVPPGQVLFNGLNSGDYTVTVSKNGYQIFSDFVIVNSDWQQREVILSP